MLKFDDPEVSGKTVPVIFLKYVSYPVEQISFLHRGGDMVLSKVFWDESCHYDFAATLAHVTGKYH